ncbi:MAG: phosphoenolpyruvate--protein phosphotransferase [Pseudomonadales bacterium]
MLSTLRRIVQDVDDSASFRVALDTIVSAVRDALGTEVCSVYLLDAPHQRFVFAATEGLNQALIGRFSMAMDEGLVGLVAARAEPINLEDASAHPRFHAVGEIGEEPFRAFLGVPIIHHRVVLGVLVVQQGIQRRFDESEESFLVTLAAQLANAVSHASATGEINPILGEAVAQPDRLFRGIGGAPGVAIGQAVVMHPTASLDSVPDREAEDVTVELMVFDRAINAVRADIANISEEFAESLPAEELALFDAYLHMLDDNAISGDVRKRIQKGQWAQGALRSVIREHVRRFEDMSDSYLRERGADVRDLGLRVLAYLQDIRQRKVHFPLDTILVADEVTPTMLTSIPAERLAGIVSLRGSSSSHVAILARALGIPAVMGAVDLPLLNMDAEKVVVDGYYGEVIVHPSAQRIADYAHLLREEADFSLELDALKDLPCETQDGWRVRLWVNIGLTGDISRSLDRGAEGIGLFRTEIPFMSQDRFPSEEEQRVVYREHMAAFEPRPVTMRTLDIGGDKALSYFPIAEENPFLGWRGIRVTLDHPEIFLVQVRAMIKANAGLEGVLRIMLPMISSLDEVEEARVLVEQAYAEVLEEGVEVKRPLIGVMIEVPAAVYQANELAKRTDFLAVGSNDLTQYMLAVDRNNPRVAELYQDFHPAVLAALREVGRAAHRQDKPLGICGEMAGTPAGAVLLMAMGYHVLSMNATNLPRVKWVLRNISRSLARRMLAKVLRMHTAEEVVGFMRAQLIEAGLGRVLPHHHDEPLQRVS